MCLFSSVCVCVQYCLFTLVCSAVRDDEAPTSNVKHHETKNLERQHAKA